MPTSLEIEILCLMLSSAILALIAGIVGLSLIDKKEIELRRMAFINIILGIIVIPVISTYLAYIRDWFLPALCTISFSIGFGLVCIGLLKFIISTTLESKETGIKIITLGISLMTIFVIGDLTGVEKINLFY